MLGHFPSTKSNGPDVPDHLFLLNFVSFFHGILLKEALALALDRLSDRSLSSLIETPCVDPFTPKSNCIIPALLLKVVGRYLSSATILGNSCKVGTEGHRCA